MKTRIFHLGDYRRATVGPGQDVPDDYFFVNGELTRNYHCFDASPYLWTVLLIPGFTPPFLITPATK